MGNVNELDSRISQFVVRIGYSRAERKDLQTEIVGEVEKPDINVELNISPFASAIRIDTKLKYEDALANYEVLVSGQWLSDQEDAFAEDIEEESSALEELIMTVLVPQIIPVAQAKILELSRSIDCAFVSFPYGISRDMRNQRLGSSSNAAQDSNED